MGEQADICTGPEMQKYEVRHGSRCVDNIKTNLTFCRCDGVKYIELC